MLEYGMMNVHGCVGGGEFGFLFRNMVLVNKVLG